MFAHVLLSSTMIESSDKIFSFSERDSGTIHLPEIERKIIIKYLNYKCQLEERWFSYYNWVRRWLEIEHSNPWDVFKNNM